MRIQNTRAPCPLVEKASLKEPLWLVEFVTLVLKGRKRQLPDYKMFRMYLPEEQLLSVFPVSHKVEKHWI